MTNYIAPNYSLQPTGGSRFAQPVFEEQRRLPPVADALRWSLAIPSLDAARSW